MHTSHCSPRPPFSLASRFSSTSSVSCASTPFYESHVTLYSPRTHVALSSPPLPLTPPSRLQPYDFIIPVMRGVASRMDSERSAAVPSSTSIVCPSFGGRGLFNINNLVDCITEAGNLFGQWTSGISTRGYANDILKTVLAHEAQAYPSTFTPKRLVYGRGYGGQVVNDLQHIVNCNYMAGGGRFGRPLRCAYANAFSFGGNLPAYCSSGATPTT